MNIRISTKVEQALKENKAVVALESTIISHGMPYPKNVECALAVEKNIEEEGAVAATIGIIDGEAIIGMTPEEIEVIRAAGLKIFPIFQTYGGEASYFTRSQGSDDAATAVAAAKNLGFPQGTTIYFAVDYDVLVADMDTHIIPYFCGIQDEAGWYYRIGVYGPRMVCNTLQ